MNSQQLMKKLSAIILFVILSSISAFAYTKDETIEIVASTLYHEARSEYKNGGLEAVASIIQNRSEQKRWKKLGLAGICLQKKQFSCHNSGYKKAHPTKYADKLAYKKCKDIATKMVNGTFKSTVKGNHYCTVNCKVYWKSQLSDPVVVGNHIFGTI